MNATHLYNYTLNIESSKTLANSLNNINDMNDSYFNKLIRILTTRCMMPAQYFNSGQSVSQSVSQSV